MCLKGNGQGASDLLSRCQETEGLMQLRLAGKAVFSRMGSMCMGVAAAMVRSLLRSCLGQPKVKRSCAAA